MQNQDVSRAMLPLEPIEGPFLLLLVLAGNPGILWVVAAVPQSPPLSSYSILPVFV